MIGTKNRIITWLLAQPDDKEFQIKLYKKGRTKNQNALYWQFLGELARVLRMSKTEMHNRIMRDYGVIWMVGNKAARSVLPDTDETERETLMAETYHLKPTAQTQELKDGITYRTYVLLKPSHDMNTAEFSALVDGLFEECRQQGIETISERELAEIRRIEARQKKKAEKKRAV